MHVSGKISTYAVALKAATAMALLAAAAGPALAGGGNGGTGFGYWYGTGGQGYTGEAGNPPLDITRPGGAGGGGAGGGAGGDAAVANGGAGGTALSRDGQDGENATSGDGGGGGGGGYNGIVTPSLMNGTTLSGGNGGKGGDAHPSLVGGGGGGGAGGYGAVATGTGISVNDGVITGGNGGRGGASGNYGNFPYPDTGGDGGSGGIGVYFVVPGAEFVNDGTVRGGNGGEGGAAVSPGRAGHAGAGGDGVAGDNLKIGNSINGVIAGGHSNGEGGTGGAGVVLTSSGAGASNLDNYGKIVGGTGGNAAPGFSGYGNGGVGLSVTGNAVIFNRNLIEGGVGGTNGGGGNGGTGLNANSGSGFINIFNLSGATIIGGLGGAPGSGDVGGVGIEAIGDVVIDNRAGASILGGPGGAAAQNSSGGVGVKLSNGASVGNAGTIAGTGGVLAGSGAELTNALVLNSASGSIEGGHGNGASQGAAAIRGYNADVVNAGRIVGGRANDGTGAQSAAIMFTGGTNSLEIHSGSTIVGDVVGNGFSDTLALGGTASDTFDMSQVNDVAQYQGFEHLRKSGSSTWTLTGVAMTNADWNVVQGTLAVTNSSALGGGAVVVDGSLGQSSVEFSGSGTSAGARSFTLQDGGSLVFRDNTDAGSSTIDIASGGIGGVQFTGTSSAASATINSHAAPGAVGVYFRQQSTAGNATINSSNGTIVSFSGSSNAGTAQLTNNAATTWFTQTSSAGSATIINNQGATTEFRDSSAASSARITNNDGGALRFFGTSTALNATVANGAGGVVDISGLTATGISIGALSGDGSVALGSKVLAIGNLNASGAIGGVISGQGGSFVKTGTGTLVLSGVNTYSGGTTVAGGSLEVTGDANLGDAAGGLTLDGGFLKASASFGSTRAVLLSGEGGFDVSGGATLALGGVVGGAGDLLKRGSGTLALTGANSYGGNTMVEAGELIGNTGSIRGDIGNAATLVFDQSVDASFLGNIGGLAGTNGRMVKRGVGELALAGASGLDWTVESGRLVSSAERFAGSVAIGAAGTFTFDQGTDSRYSGVLSGDGHFSKTGTGVLQLSGNSSGFAGVTTVAAGVLSLERSAILGGTLMVASGGTLAGTGTVGTATIASAGTLAPGNSIGTLTVNGDLTFQAGSRFLVEANPGGTDSDLIKVGGEALLNGGSVTHIGANGNYDLRSTYTILSAGTLSGTFETVTSDFAFLTPQLIYDYGAGKVDLELRRNKRDFASAALTPNQKATAAGIESIGLDGGNRVYDAVAQLPDDTGLIRASFDALSGEIHASARSALVEDSHFVRDAASDRIRAAFEGVGAAPVPVLSYAGGEASLAPATGEALAVWGRAFGAWGALDSDGNAARLDHSTGGFITGGDVALGETGRIGLLAGYSHASLHVDDRASSGSSENYHLGVYGGTQYGALGIRTGLAYTWHDLDMERSVAIPGFSDSLNSSYDAGTFQAFGELGYRMDTASVSFEPFANLAYVNLHTDAFSESGGAAALSGASGTTQTTFTTLGVRASADLPVSSMQATVRGMVGWRHAFGDTTPLSAHRLAGSGAFEIAGTPIAKDAAVIEAGMDFAVTKAATLSLSYEGQFGEGARQNGFDATLQLKF